jgi:plastocyanin
MSLNRLQRIARSIALAAALAPLYGNASSLQIQITDSRGKTAAGIGIVVETSTPEPLPATAPKAIIDQHREQFVPRVTIVQRGTEVSFPNTDRVQHHVYSFSAAKQFELALYRGNEHPPVTFDHDGIAVLGCNIHDHMVGYVLIVDSRHFGFTDRDGRLVLDDLPNEPVKVTMWHPDLDVEFGPINRTVDITAGKNIADIHLDRAWQAAQETSLSWNDY